MSMDRVFPRKVLLGVTGGIAAFKAPLLVRALVKSGAQVQVVMTRSAHDFVTPLALSTVSGRPALTELIERNDPAAPPYATWNDHVHLARWADVMLIAPATANTLARMAQGLCDDLLLACYLSAEAPVFVAPAMDLEMYRDPATQANLDVLRSRGVRTIGPDHGELASGLSGEGRMTEPDAIVGALIDALLKPSKLAGKRILISAGPTQEAIDPVRYIGNRSTGKMGFALAEEAAARGAHVQLVAGPVALRTDDPGITRTDVISAREMANACKARFPHCDVAIMSAAVADWRPAQVAAQKLKKGTGLPTLALEATEDILAWMGANKGPAQTLVGFALETHDEESQAHGKLQRKNLDLVVMNSLNTPGAGFGHDTNQVTLIGRDKNIVRLPLQSKTEVARAILDRLEELC
jgi:phosphopantothenoylcysteine decarboxylase/phosphopantothenate--cysteine ligase